MNYEPDQKQLHSSAWIAQVWVSFIVAVGAGVIGIYHLPVDPWTRAFLGLTFAMAISSSLSLAKTLRDIHESERLVNRVDEAKVNRLLTDQPLPL